MTGIHWCKGCHVHNYLLSNFFWNKYWCCWKFESTRKRRITSCVLRFKVNFWKNNLKWWFSKIMIIFCHFWWYDNTHFTSKFNKNDFKRRVLVGNYISPDLAPEKMIKTYEKRIYFEYIFKIFWILKFSGLMLDIAINPIKEQQKCWNFILV